MYTYIYMYMIIYIRIYVYPYTYAYYSLHIERYTGDKEYIYIDINIYRERVRHASMCTVYMYIIYT